MNYGIDLFSTVTVGSNKQKQQQTTTEIRKGIIQIQFSTSIGWKKTDIKTQITLHIRLCYL